MSWARLVWLIVTLLLAGLAPRLVASLPGDVTRTNAATNTFGSTALVTVSSSGSVAAASRVVSYGINLPAVGVLVVLPAIISVGLGVVFFGFSRKRRE